MCPLVVFGCHVIAVGGTMLCGTGAQGPCQILNLFSTCLPRNLKCRMYILCSSISEKGNSGALWRRQEGKGKIEMTLAAISKQIEMEIDTHGGSKLARVGVEENLKLEWD